ncbi:MAG: Cof-type HAD-IIB family hydrolase, partial [Oscillospiraceae bacterium]
KTLYISDLDGTLLQNNGELSQKTIEIINKAIKNGLHFSFATARTSATALKMTEKLNIITPVILMNGVCVFDTQTFKYIKINSFSQNGLKSLIKVIKNLKLSGFLFSINEKTSQLTAFYENLETPNAQNFMEERIKKFDKKFVCIEDFSYCKTIQNEKIVYYSVSDKMEKLEQAYAHLKKISELNVEFYKDTYNKDFWYLEVACSTASKYSALKFIKENFNFNKIISFGDNLNDLPLFKASDYSLAPQNAKKEVKEKANEIIDYNYNDGVAKYIEKTWNKIGLK